MSRKPTRPTPASSPPRPPPTYVAARTSPTRSRPCSASPKSATPPTDDHTFALRINKAGGYRGGPQVPGGVGADPAGHRYPAGEDGSGTAGGGPDDAEAAG